MQNRMLSHKEGVMDPVHSLPRLAVVVATAAGLLALSTPASGAETRNATAPQGRSGTRLAYDAARKVVVMFGGETGPIYGFLGDTWTWDGATWTEQHPATSPSPRYGMGMAYDAARRVVVLFGGYDGLVGDENDTWTWDGTTWTKQHPVTSPPAGEALSLAYDSVLRRVILWDGDIWTWDGTDWTKQPPGRSPVYWDSSRTIYDVAANQVVYLGGDSCGDLGCQFNLDTYTWNGHWQKQGSRPHPAGREAPGLAYDGATHSTVLFGGWGNQGYVPDTWVWDGRVWTQRHPASWPPGRESMGIAYDRATRQVVLFGGTDEINWFADTWTWNGKDWVEL
jgi:hypothetical protein